MEGRVETLEEGPRLEFISWKGTEGHDDWWARLMQHEELKRSIFKERVTEEHVEKIITLVFSTHAYSLQKMDFRHWLVSLLFHREQR